MTAYLDAAASTPVSPSVLKAMLPFFSKNFGNAHSSHKLGDISNNAVESSREILAKSIHASPDQIVFTSGGSESNSSVLHQSKNIAVSSIEHSSILYPTINSSQILGVDSDCLVVPSSIKKSVNLVSVMHVNNETGVIQDVKYWCDTAHDSKALFHSDAVQSFCKLPINVKKIDFDFLSFSAHKINGPKGVGALFIRDPSKFKPLILGSDPLRSGSPNVHGIVGFGEAVRTYSHPSPSVVREFHKFSDLGIVNGSRKRIGGLLNISFEGISSSDIIQHLSHQNVFVSSGAACDSSSRKASHVLEAMNLSKFRINSAIRFSVHSLTTLKEIKFAKKKLSLVLDSLKRLK